MMQTTKNGRAAPPYFSGKQETAHGRIARLYHAGEHIMAQSIVIVIWGQILWPDDLTISMEAPFHLSPTLPEIRGYDRWGEQTLSEQMDKQMAKRIRLLGLD